MVWLRLVLVAGSHDCLISVLAYVLWAAFAVVRDLVLLLWFIWWLGGFLLRCCCGWCDCLRGLDYSVGCTLLDFCGVDCGY